MKSSSSQSSLETTPSGELTPNSKNTTNLNYIRKHDFVERPSLLDEDDNRSLLKQSHFMGFYNCIYMICCFYFITYPIIRKKETGYYFATELYDMVERDFLMCLFTWPLFYLWSYLAYLQQILKLRNVPSFLLFVMQHLSQGLMFLYSQYLVITRNWCVSHAAFVTMQSCVFFMKMHSYTMTNQKLHREWVYKGKPKSNDETVYPQNVNLKNFTLYLWFPVLVYETSYPRTKKIRPYYLIKKIVYALAMLLLDYQLVANHILPVFEKHQEMSLVQSVSAIVFPLAAFVIVTFVLTFENYLNAFAELTCYGDRLFYQDWWNSTNQEEFNRKWNRPVHEFLYRHVYIEFIFELGFSVKKSQLITFLFSALLHEYILAVMIQQVYLIMMVFMMVQIPIVMMTKSLKGTQSGNKFYWFSIFFGTPLIVNLYLRFEEIVEKGLSIII